MVDKTPRQTEITLPAMLSTDDLEEGLKFESGKRGYETQEKKISRRRMCGCAQCMKP